MNRTPSLRLLVVGCVLLGLQSCDFYQGKDFVKGGSSQPDLRSLFERHSSIALTDGETVLNAYSDAGRDPTFWFEVSFDSKLGDKLREMLLRKGYVVRTDELRVLPRKTPRKIAGWWDSAAIDKAALFTLQRDALHADTDGVWCFLHEKKGILFACSFSH